MWLLDGTLKNTFELHTGDRCTPSWRCPTTSTRSPARRDGTVKLFNVNDGAVLRTFTHHTARHALALLPDGLRFVSGADDNTACIAYHGLAPH